MTQIYPVPEGFPSADDFTVKADGEPVFVYDSEVAVWASFGLDGKASIEITRDRPFNQVVVRPLSRDVKPQIAGNTLRFELDRPATLSIEFDDEYRRPLFLFANAPETDLPDTASDDVISFEPGRVHEVEQIELRDGQTLYVPAGAVLRTRVRSQDANNIRICGRGVIDGSLNVEPRSRLLLLRDGKGVRVDGVTLFNSQTWTTVPVACRDVAIDDVRIIGWHGGDDGIDVVGCEDVTIRNCFIRSKDDCIAIKATGGGGRERADGCKSVRNVLVEKCVFWNAEWGNALEIGYETRGETISDITFRDCDVIRCEREGYSSGGTFTIHNGDRADVHNVLYENIRVEDSREKLIDFKIAHTRYSRDEQRGQVHDVTLRNIDIVDGPMPVSIVQGYDGEHMIADVTIDGLRYRGEPIRTILDLKLVTEIARGIRIVGGESFKA